MITPINAMAEAWWQWMSQMFWQATLFILIIYIIDLLIRSWAWPQVRYALWLLVLVKLVIPPEWSLATSAISHVQPQLLSVVNARLKPVRLLEHSGIKPPNAPASTSEGIFKKPGPSPSADQSPPGDLTLSAASLIMLVWFAGVVFFGGLLAIKIRRLRRWHQQQREKGTIPQWFHEKLVHIASQIGLQRLPAIVFSDETVTPAVYGMMRPVLLLPAHYLDELSEIEGEHVLLHELAHLKRGDLWLHGLCLLLQMIYWFNPLLVLVRKQTKHVREICCDMTVANILKEKTMDYRKTLLNTARELLTERTDPGLALLGVFEEPFRLVTRLKWLEKKTWLTRKRAMATATLTSAVVIMVLMPMSGLESQSTLYAEKEDNEWMTTAKKETAQPEKTVQTDIGPVTIKMTEPLYAATLPMVGPPDDLFEEAVEKLRKGMKTQGIKPSGYLFGRFFSDQDKVPSSRYAWEVGYPVPPGTKVKAPLEIIRMYPHQVASLRVEGLKDRRQIWQEFVETLDEKGYIVAFPPAMEVYTGADIDKEFWWRTEIQIPVFRDHEGYPGMKITVKDEKAGRGLVLPMRGSYAQHESAIRQLKEYVRSNRIETIGDPVGIYFSLSSETIPAEYYWEVGYEVGPEVVATEPFRIREYDAGTFASTEFRGPAATLEYPWTPFIVQSVLQGDIPVGPGIEIWHEDAGTVELQIPIIRMGDFGQGMAEWGKQFGKGMAEWGQRFGKEMSKWGKEEVEQSSKDKKE